MCDKHLPTKAMLREHVKTHSETRELYQCNREDCGRAYSALKNLKAHIRSYHEGVKFECHTDGCTRKFSTKVVDTVLLEVSGEKLISVKIIE